MLRRSQRATLSTGTLGRLIAEPRLSSRVPAWTAPIVWIGLIGVLLAIGPEGHPALRLSLFPLVPVCLVASVGLAISWRALTSREPIRRALPLVAIAMLVPIQFLPGWDGVHDGVIVILPLSWAALQGHRADVVWGVFGAAAVCFAGPLVDRYIPPSLLFDALTITVWSIAALTLNRVVVRASRQAHELTISFTDTLTGLPNRRGWDDLLAASLAAAQAFRAPISVLILDRDDFGAYNEDWGHEAGDRELMALAAAWREVLRAGDVMARVGADEFAMALPNSRIADAHALVARLRAATVGSTFAAGTAQWDGEESASDLTARCAAALAEAKRHRRAVGGTRVSAAGPGQPGWEAVLPTLVREGAVASVYQPIVRLADGGTVAYEALARPSGAAADLQVDGMFIGARKQGLAAELEVICVRAAVSGARALPRDLDLFINIGTGALHLPDDMVRLLTDELAHTGRTPAGVVLEISETVTRIGRFASAMACLRRAGFRLALDDAGEANSAIESLAVVRPAFIKLGRSLAMNYADAGAAATIHALVQFATFAGGLVIAEGIENREDCGPLAALGVQLGQGFALGRPGHLGDLAEAPASLAS